MYITYIYIYITYKYIYIYIYICISSLPRRWRSDASEPAEFGKGTGIHIYIYIYIYTRRLARPSLCTVGALWRARKLHVMEVARFIWGLYTFTDYAFKAKIEAQKKHWISPLWRDILNTNKCCSESIDGLNCSHPHMSVYRCLILASPQESCKDPAPGCGDNNSQDSSKGGAVETGCSDLYGVIYWFTT